MPASNKVYAIAHLISGLTYLEMKDMAETLYVIHFEKEPTEDLSFDMMDTLSKLSECINNREEDLK